jgi:hypothetical protein
MSRITVADSVAASVADSVADSVGCPANRLRLNTILY